ncbi:hypothetical protein Scep_022453 [Stephania cephalantha]|uniref:Uncharacterized protein n=1 Tax=Stephania cephalantha TaxID=152367 RepID=A0AAP0FHL3_9MAGN
MGNLRTSLSLFIFFAIIWLNCFGIGVAAGGSVGYGSGMMSLNKVASESDIHGIQECNSFYHRAME